MTLNFICRASKKLKDGLNPLELSIIIGNERKVVTLERHYDAHTFNSKKQHFYRNEEANEYLNAIRAKLYAIETEVIKRNMPLTTNTIVDVFQHGFADTNVSFLSLFERHNMEAKEKVKRGLIVPATYHKYLLTQRYLSDFIKAKLKREDILLIELTPAIVEQFYVYLCAFMEKNTAIHKMKLLKKILRIAQDEGYIRAMPFKIKLVSDALCYEPLTLDEIRTIKNKDFGCARLNQVRDVFIFACYSGLAFTDLKNLTKEDVFVDEQGKEWIIKARQKTKVISHIPLLPIAKDILEKYNFQLPVLTNQKYNGYLKEIADICMIKKNLHTHLARHTFATILLNGGVDIVSVSKVLGHSNSRITEHTYAKLMPSTLMERVSAVADKII